MNASSTNLSGKHSNTGMLPFAEALEERRMLASELAWGVGWGYPDVYSSANHSVTDANGNTYVAGIFRGRINVATEGQSPRFIVSNNAKDDIFIAKYRHDGTLLWIRAFGGKKYETVTALTLGPDGSLYLGGTFQDTIKFALGKSNTPALVSRGKSDAYVVRLNPASGTPMWSGSAGGVQDDSVTSIAVDSAGRLYVAGWIRRSGNIALTGKAVTLSARGADDTFIQRVNPANGSLLWHREFGENKTQEAALRMVADPAGGLIASGIFNDKVQFDRSSSRFTLKAVKSYDIYIAGIDPNGKFRYVRQFGGKHEDHLSDMVLAPNGDLYFTGYFESDINLSANPSKPFYLEAEYDVSVYISRMRPDGSIVWAGHIGSDDHLTMSALAVDPSGNVYLAGAFTDDTDFDPGKGTKYLTFDKDKAGIVPGQYDASDAFLLKLDVDGKFVSVDQIGGADGSVVYHDVGVTASGAVSLVGQFTRTIDIDPGTGKKRLRTPSDDDTTNVLVMRLLTT